MWTFNNRLDVIQPEEAEAIRSSALRVLAQIGMQVVDPRLREVLCARGASMEGDVVRFPEQVVVDAVSQAPKRVAFWDREGLEISSHDGCSYHGTAPSAVAILGYDGARRTSTYRDVADLTRLADGLPGIDFISPPAIAQDCPPEWSGVLTAKAVFCNTIKFCLAFALNWEEAEAWIAMAESLGNRGERPTIGFAISPTSPLVLGKQTSDILMGVAERGFPIITAPGGMSGATDPYSIAGTLVLEHAEALAIVIIAQLVRPGTPCVLGLASAIMDMASGSISLGMAERTLLLNAVAPLARAWGLPGYAPVGASDSFELDEQAGAEKMLSFVTQFAAGLEFSSGVGRMEGGLSVSYEGLVIDHDLLQMARRYLRGIRIDARTLAGEVIAQVGPGGNFLGEEHTLNFLHGDEFELSPISNRRALNNGGRCVREAAHDRVLEILSEHPSPVPEEQQKALAQIIAERLDR